MEWRAPCSEKQPSETKDPYIICSCHQHYGVPKSALQECSGLGEKIKNEQRYRLKDISQPVNANM